MSWNMPADKICEKLKKKDSQICELRYGKKAKPTFSGLFADIVFN